MTRKCLKRKSSSLISRAVQPCTPETQKITHSALDKTPTCGPRVSDFYGSIDYGSTSSLANYTLH